MVALEELGVKSRTWEGVLEEPPARECTVQLHWRGLHQNSIVIVKVCIQNWDFLEYVTEEFRF